MHFAYPLYWWAAPLLVLTAALAAYAAYARWRLGSKRQVALAALRASALLLLLLVLFRPLLPAAASDSRGSSVAILVDQSRSMSIEDVNGRRRIDVAADAVRSLLPRLSGRLQADLLAFGGPVSPVDTAHLSNAEQSRTDLRNALRAVTERYRGRGLAGVVVVSDGGNTDREEDASYTGRVPVFAVGVGGNGPDREVKSITATETSMVGSAVDIDAVVTSRGLGSEPFDVRLLAGGRTLDVRRVAPVENTPTHVRFSVSPDATTPVVYSVEIPADDREKVAANNVAGVVVPPAVRKRRILFVQGAPGFEHSFLRRAWAADPALEVDSVVRKGKNDEERDAYFVQAEPSRTPALIGGYPTTKSGLFVYDAIVFGSVEWDSLTRDQMAMTAEFVRERGGGILVFGARSFASAGLAGSPLEDVLPLQPSPGRPAIARTSGGGEAGAPNARTGDNKVRLTPDGREHAAMRLAGSAVDNERAWNVLPPLAATNILGAARPGASLLAVATADGASRPVVAVQRYGRGRAFEFTGEGSWRWKMLMPASDKTHEMFWRQAARWLSAGTPDPVTIVPTEGAQPGEQVRVDVLAADEEFRPVGSAVVNVRLTTPRGEIRSVKATLSDAATGRYSANALADSAGLYRADAEARLGSHVLGASTAWFLAGSIDPEFADPRLNDRVLQRLASQSRGQYVAADNIGKLPDLLSRAAQADPVDARPRDAWHHPLVLVSVLGLLGGEWALRRRWGLR